MFFNDEANMPKKTYTIDSIAGLIINEYLNVSSFLNQKTSTLRGMKSFYNNTMENLGLENKKYSTRTMSRFWKLYNKYVDENLSVSEKDKSKEFLKYFSFSSSKLVQ